MASAPTVVNENMDSEETYHKREGTTVAAEGPDYEMKIIMLIIARCSALNLSFKIKSNVYSKEKHFDDIVAEFTKKSQPEAKEKRQMFLQAKRLTGKKASIFAESKKLKIKPNVNNYPTSDVQLWFNSFEILSEQCADFEMMFFTTVDIEECWKQHFVVTESIFEDVLLPQSAGTDVSYRVKIYGLNTEKCIEALKELCTDETKIKEFCRSFRIFAIQPDSSHLESMIKGELMIPNQDTKERIYNKTSNYLSEWWKTTGQVPVFNFDAFLKAECEELFTFPEKTDRDFYFNDETIHSMEQNSKVISVIVEAENFQIYVDFLNQWLRGVRSYLFKFSDYLKRQDKFLELFKTVNLTTCVVIKIKEFGTHDVEQVKNALESLLTLSQTLTDLQLVFLIAKSAVSDDFIPENFPSPHIIKCLSFSSLNEKTKTKVLDFEIKYLGRKSSFGKLNLPVSALENLLDETILTEIRHDKSIVIGEALSSSGYEAETYILRKLNAFKIKSPRGFVISNDIKDTYFIVASEEEKTMALQEWGLGSSGGLENTSSNITFICPENQSEYEEACQRNEARGIHLLRIVDTELIVLKSRTEIKNDGEISYFITKDITEESFYEIFIKSPSIFKVLLVVSNAGMGKSSLAYSLQQKLSSDATNFWPIVIPLNKYFAATENRKARAPRTTRQEQFRNCDFLPKCKYFNTFLELGRVVVLLDGVDEIAPKHTQAVLSVIDSLLKRKVHRIIVLTRTYLQDEIVKSTCALPVELQTFTQDEVRSFLEKYYTSDPAIQRSSNSGELKTFITCLVDFIYSKKREHWTDITGVPLQTKMVADVFRERCRKYLEDGSSEALPSQDDDNKDIYHEFIEEKFQIYLEEKLILNAHAKENLEETLREEFVKSHTLCANNLIFQDTDAFEHWNVGERRESATQDILKCGIVTALTSDYTEFSHRSFAEYFCALQIRNILLHGGPSMQVKFIFNLILVEDQYKLLRKLLDQTLSNTEEGLGVFKGLDEDKDFLSTFFDHESSSSILYKAIVEENFNLAIKLFSCTDKKWSTARNALICYKDWFGRTPLQLAVKSKHFKLIDCMVDSVDSPDALESTRSPPLQWIVQNEQTFSCQLDVADSNSVEGETGRPPLYLAAFRGQLDLVMELLENGADPNCPGDQQRTALHVAAGRGHNSIVDLLLDRGADLEARCVKGHTALHLASSLGQTSIASLLLEKGCPVDCKDNESRTPLHFAAAGGHDSTIELLLDHGANIETWNKNGLCALHMAAGFGHTSTVRLLADRGCPIDAEDGRGSTPLYCASERGHAAVVELLLDRGANAQVRTKEGYAAIHWASLLGHISVVRLLVTRGCPVNIRDYMGRTPLITAALVGRVESARVLITELGAAVAEADNGGNTPIHYASAPWDGDFKDDPSTSKLLLELGAEINCRNESGTTPLTVAFKRGRKNIAEYLISLGAVE